MADITSLTKQRTTLKANLSRFETFLTTHGTQKKDQLKLRLNKIYGILDEYNTIQNK